jgi:hypothetical protein
MTKEIIDGNIHFVSKSQWKKWNKAEQEMFNAMYYRVLDNQRLYMHPMAAKQSDECWKTTAWNTAWEAAEIMRWMRKKGKLIEC